MHKQYNLHFQVICQTTNIHISHTNTYWKHHYLINERNTNYVHGVIVANNSLATAQGKKCGNRAIPGSNYNFKKFQFHPELQTDTHTERR